MRRVLVVDDETAITEGLIALFELEKIGAAGAADRRSAETLISGEFFPLILADLRIKSEEEGLLLLESIRRISPRSKVASLTAYSTPEIDEKLTRLGSTVVLQKPMDFEQIVAIANEILGAIDETEGAPQGDSDFARLYSDVRRILYSIPQRRYGLTSDETEELVQQTWSLFLQKRESILLARPWLTGTLVNLCKQQIYQKTRNRELTTEITADHEQWAAAPAGNDAVMMVRQALARLDDRSRQLCVLIGMEGWSYDEAAAEIGLPIGSVGPLYIRAKKKLRRALEVAH